MYNNFTVEIRKRLYEFEEIEISRQSCKRDCEQQGGKLLRLLSGRILPLFSPERRHGFTRVPGHAFLARCSS
jgi:hypothetical protein